MSRLMAALAALMVLTGCATRLSDQPVEPARFGTPVSTSQMLAALQRPGTVRVEKIVAADWPFRYVSSDPHVKPPVWQLGLLDAQVHFYALHRKGGELALIDSGFPENPARHVGWIARWFLDIDETLKLRQATGAWLNGRRPEAVFLTHLHFDHAMGLREVPKDVPVFVGPGDGAQENDLHLFIASATAAGLIGRPPLREWQFRGDPDGKLVGVIDIYGDGSVFAIRTPGHTPGSTAYLVNAIDGVHLMTGDTVHSRAAWLNERIDMSAFDPDLKTLWASLAALQALAAAIPGIHVHPGHQDLGGKL